MILHILLLSLMYFWIYQYFLITPFDIFVPNFRHSWLGKYQHLSLHSTLNWLLELVLWFFPLCRSPQAVLARLRSWSKRVQTPVVLLRSLSDKYAREIYPIYPTPPFGQDMTPGQFFKWSLTGLNSQFSFS